MKDERRRKEWALPRGGGMTGRSECQSATAKEIQRKMDPFVQRRKKETLNPLLNKEEQDSRRMTRENNRSRRSSSNGIWRISPNECSAAAEGGGGGMRLFRFRRKICNLSSLFRLLDAGGNCRTGVRLALATASANVASWCCPPGSRKRSMVGNVRYFSMATRALR